MAYLFEHEGRELVARVPKHDLGDNGISYITAADFEKGNNIPNLQHLVAAAPENGITITELLQGKNLDDMSYDELAAIPDEHFKQAIQLGLTMHDNGLRADPKTSNYMYNKKTGFALLDYSRFETKSDDLGPYLSALTMVRSIVDGKSSTMTYRGDEPYDSCGGPIILDSIVYNSL